MRPKEKLRQAAQERRTETEWAATGTKMDELPFPAAESFRLLGMKLDCRRTFREHLKDAREKLRVRRGVLGKVSNTAWGLETRALTTTAHALIESPITYGLTATGSAAV